MGADGPREQLGVMDVLSDGVGVVFWGWGSVVVMVGKLRFRLWIIVV